MHTPLIAIIYFSYLLSSIDDTELPLSYLHWAYIDIYLSLFPWLVFRHSFLHYTIG